MGRTLAYGYLAIAILCGASLFAERVLGSPEVATLRDAAPTVERTFRAAALRFPETSKPRTALIRQDGALECLALNIYWEARSESLDGQKAVAAVTLNRVKDARFPDTVCGVTRQGGQKRLNRCQFSWWCDGKSDEPTNAVAWQASKALARRALFGELTDPTGGALWYHATYVSPSWTNRKVQTAWIGQHIFYRNPAFEKYIQLASTDWDQPQTDNAR